MSKLTDEYLNDILQEVYGFRLEQWELDHGGGLPMTFARAIESAATEPLLQRIAELERENQRLRAQIGQGEPGELSDDDISELAHSANEEALSFGIGHHLFLRYFKTVRNRALASAPPAPQQKPPTVQHLPADDTEGGCIA